MTRSRRLSSSWCRKREGCAIGTGWVPGFTAWRTAWLLAPGLTGRGNALWNSQEHVRNTTPRPHLQIGSSCGKKNAPRWTKRSLGCPRQRCVLVLVDLEGQSQGEAARRLGWSEGSVRGRLARARAALRERLVRRGVAPAVVPITGSFFEQGLAPSVPAALREATARAGMATLLAGRATPSASTVISASVAALTRNVTRGMTLAKVASLATVFCAIAAVAVLLGTVHAGLSAAAPTHQKPAPPAASAAATQAKPPVDRSVLQTLEVRVISRSDKQPIAGASIHVSYWDANSDHEIEGTADAQGSCKIELPRDVTSITIYAAKDGFVPTRESWPETKIRQGLPSTTVLQLEPGSPIGGFVKDEDGQPVAGAIVTVALNRGKSSDADIDLPEGNSMHVYAGYPCITVKTDAQGHWRASILPEGAERDTRLWFRVSHPDFVRDSGGYSRRLSIKTARAFSGALPLRRGLRIAGQAHAAHGQAISGATVILAYSASSGDFLRTTTDAAGQFAFAHANERARLGRYCVSVEAAGFSPAWKMLVPREGTPALDFELTAAKPFTGRVVDSQGRPVAGASVEPQWQECHFFDWKATTDAGGRFVWLSAPPKVRSSSGCARPGSSRPSSAESRRGQARAPSR